jgi:hypothetical protein
MNLSISLNAYTRALGLEKLLGTDNPTPHPHRFRKTMARVIALSLVHAPKILMDCFGHLDEEMTIRSYILSDPMVANEIRQMQRDLVILLGVETIKNAAELEGRAAKPLREQFDAYMKRLGAKATEPQSLYEFSQVLTDNGTSWGVVAPGIICTSFVKGGLCNQFQGQADPALCHPRCDSQLVACEYVMPDGDVASAKAQACRVIEFNLQQLQMAVDSDECLLIAAYAGQIVAWLYRWKDVYEKFQHHPLVQAYCGTEQAA